MKKHLKESTNAFNIDHLSHTLHRNTAFLTETGSFSNAGPAQLVPSEGKAYIGADLAEHWEGRAHVRVPHDHLHP